VKSEWEIEERLYALEEENEDLKLELFKLRTKSVDGKPLAKALHEFVEWHSGPETTWTADGFHGVSRALWEALDSQAKNLLGHSLPRPAFLEVSYGRNKS